MDQKVSQLPVTATGSLDEIMAKLAPEAYYQSPGGRRFLIAAALLAGIQRGAKALDVACGIGPAAVDLAEAFGCRVSAFDNFAPYLAFGRQLAASRGALALATPITRYRPSSRPFPETLPPVEYAPGDAVRRVDAAGQINWQGRRWAISDALAGQPVGLRPTLVDGVVEVRFGHHLIRRLSLRDGACDTV